MYRLHRSQDIEQMFRVGKSISDGGVQMRVKKNAYSHVRAGVIVPKKHIAQAVKRNRTKRLLREACRSLITAYDISNLDILLIVVNSRHPQSFHEYRDLLTHMYQTQFI